jgi:hypothetical protein
MALVSEAIARYHKLIESEPYIDLTWAVALQERKKALKLNGGVSPVLRPHFLTQRDMATLGKASELIASAVERVEQMALATPALLARMHLLPAERMLAAAEPGYSAINVATHLHTNLNDASLRFTGHSASAAAGVIYGDALADLYFEAPPVKEFRKKFKLSKIGGAKPLLSAILKAYKESGGKQKKPSIAIVEFHAGLASEHTLLAEFFAREGHVTITVAPEQLEYRNNVLRAGETNIDIVYRAFRLQDFLVRFDLNHALVRAYKERTICMVNSFRSDLGAKKAILDLLTDDAVTAKFPSAERKAIKDYIPWTRVVQAVKTTHKGHAVDLPEFVMKHRSKLVLKPNDSTAEVPPVRGVDVDDLTWERALRMAMRSPSVVQEIPEPVRSVFPMLQFGSLMMKDMQVDSQPHLFLGAANGASTWLSVAGSTGFSTLTGLAPTFVLEGK